MTVALSAPVRRNARAEMAALIKGQRTNMLIGAWYVGARATLPPDSVESAANAMALEVLEWEFLRRGLQLCPDCGGPAGKHIPTICDRVKAGGSAA